MSATLPVCCINPNAKHPDGSPACSSAYVGGITSDVCQTAAKTYCAANPLGEICTQWGAANPTNANTQNLNIIAYCTNHLDNAECRSRVASMSGSSAFKSYSSGMDDAVKSFCADPSNSLLPFCSCIRTATIAATTDSLTEFRAQPACIDPVCSTNGYKLSGYETSCNFTQVNCTQVNDIKANNINVSGAGLNISQNCDANSSTATNAGAMSSGSSLATTVAGENAATAASNTTFSPNPEAAAAAAAANAQMIMLFVIILIIAVLMAIGAVAYFYYNEIFDVVA